MEPSGDDAAAQEGLELAERLHRLDPHVAEAIASGPEDEFPIQRRVDRALEKHGIFFHKGVYNPQAVRARLREILGMEGTSPRKHLDAKRNISGPCSSRCTPWCLSQHD